jgi:hypothetical protein
MIAARHDRRAPLVPALHLANIRIEEVTERAGCDEVRSPWTTGLWLRVGSRARVRPSEERPGTYIRIGIALILFAMHEENVREANEILGL